MSELLTAALDLAARKLPVFPAWSVRMNGDRLICDAKLPSTWRVATGGGGQHIYFAAPSRRAPIKNSVGQLGSGIDVRGLGGYVIAPPSQHISGQRYRWDCDPDQAQLCMLPPWLAALLDHPSAKARPATEWRAIVRGEIEEGRRNDTAARLAGHLLRRYVDPHVVL
jgi:hypothetical protein